MRRILFQQTDFNSLPNPPAGFNYIGFDGVNFSEKSEDGTINQSVGATGATGPAGTGGSASSDRLISSNETHNMELVLDNKGTLNIPLMLPVSFTATCDATHYDGTASFTDIDLWEFEVEFQVSAYGTVAVMINNIFPIPTNPGYVSGDIFIFTESDHGIPDFVFDIQLNDVVQAGPAGWTSNLGVSQGPDYPSTIESLGAIKITSNDNSLVLGTDGVLYIPNGIDFPLSNGNNRTGEGNNLQFEKGSAFQKIISTQDGTELVPTVERLVISGGDSYNDGTNDVGEGGDIYLWAGKGANGGDIKVDAGESSEGEGGTVKIRGGYSEYNGGFVEISSGVGASGSGGNININSGNGSVNGGNISIQAGNGGTLGGNITLSTTDGSWIFKSNGDLVLPEGGDIKDYLGSSVLSSDVLNVTYSELTNMIGDSLLTPGKFYRIIDFKTCYDQPNYDIYKQPITTGNYKEGETIYPIIVFAISENNISQDAWQEDFPKDKIRYEVGYETTEITGGTAYGRITERIDQWNNRTDYDHREILFKRYDTFAYNSNPQAGTISVVNGVVSGIDTTFTSSFSVGDVIAIPYFSEMFFKIDTIESNGTMSLTGSVWDVSANDIKYYSIDYTMDKNSYYKNNINSEDPNYMYEYTTFGEAIDNDGAFSNYIGDHSNGFINDGYGDFLLANNVFLDGVYSNNKFGNNCYNNTFDDDCTNNTIGNWFHNNITDDDFDNNQIGNYFESNIITADFQRNNIMNDFRDNIISGGDFQNNEIGSQFNNNKVYNDFYKNDIGNGYKYNDVYSYFYGNLIGNAYHENNIYCQFYDNQIGEYYYSNDIGDINNPYDSEFYSNKIGNNFEDNTITDTVNNNVIGNQFETNTLLSDFEYNKIGNKCKGNLFQGYFTINEVGSDVKGNEFLGTTDGNNIGSYTFNNDFLGEVYNNSWIGNFYENTLGNDFSNNQIGNNFNDNQIGENFGSGAGAQGNKIGNNFYSNNIGEYFYNNSIPDNFYNNQIGNFFQWNEINTNINDTNFTLNYGNITVFTYTSTGTGASSSTYTGLTGSVSGGPGSGASFDVIVSGGTASSVTLNSTGSSNQYSINDTITILGTDIGGVTGVDDVVITVTDVTSASLFYDHYTKQIFERRLGDKRVSFYDEDDILNVDSIYISSGYIPIYSQALIFPINNVYFEFRCDGVYSNDGGGTGLPVYNVQELVTLFNASFRQFGYFFDNNDGTLGLYIDPLLKEQNCPIGTYSIYVDND